MKSRIKLALGIILFVVTTLSSCGVNTDQFPRDIDPSRQTELNGK
jgi:hypothetical protein